MFHPVIKGTYYDMGYRYRTILYKHGFRVTEQSKEKLDFGTESEGEVKQRARWNHGGYVCSHQRKIKLGTIWSITATLKELQIFRAEGHPCRTRYKQDRRLNKAIQKRQT